MSDATAEAETFKVKPRENNNDSTTHRSNPFLQVTPGSKQLIVDGKPFLVLGGELQNSSLTSAKYMRPVWERLVDANVNTVLGCVTWDMIEPKEGHFDFAELDLVIQDARSHGLRLILLWFGSFKNGLSTYVPTWVKIDPVRFPRAKLREAHGRLETADVLSIFHEEACRADARAFRALMQHVKDVDQGHFTVIMIQVENEVGLLGDSRDGGRAAEKCFSDSVPGQLVDYLTVNREKLHPDLQKKLGSFHAGEVDKSWKQVFGDSPQTDELFMAYHYAMYLEKVTSAGRNEYNIPMFTNVWQDMADEDAEAGGPVVAGGGRDPGDYPSGGGVSGVLDIWHKFAPSLDFIAPDIYLNDYEKRSVKYRHNNQPLLIPEQRRDEYGARRIWTAVGTHQALGVSPFGIDTLGAESNPFKKHYGLLSSLQTIVLEAQRRPGSSLGFFFDEIGEAHPNSKTYTARFGDFEVRIERAFVFGKPGPGAGMLIHISDAKFLLIGWGFQVVFRSLSPKSTFTGILRMEEKEVVDSATGELQTLRRLNGDETRSGKCCVMPNENPDYGGFPICVTIPARTAIAEVEVYSLEEEEEEEEVL